MNEKNIDGNKCAVFVGENRLAKFLVEYGDKYTFEEGKQMIHDYYSGKKDWLIERSGVKFE